MKSFSKNNMHDLYFSAVKHIIQDGSAIHVNGRDTKECTNISTTLTDVRLNKIDFYKTKEYNFQDGYNNYLLEELAWYETGCLSAYHAPSKYWLKIAGPNGEIQSNYGYLIKYAKHFYTNDGCTAYENVIRLLENDISSRQAILHYNLPEHYKTRSKDIPCTICSQILIRNNVLSSTVYQRSCDLRRGFIYDIPWHCYLIEEIIRDLKPFYPNLTTGSLTMVFGSLHIYNEDLDFFERFLQDRD